MYPCGLIWAYDSATRALSGQKAKTNFALAPPCDDRSTSLRSTVESWSSHNSNTNSDTRQHWSEYCLRGVWQEKGFAILSRQDPHYIKEIEDLEEELSTRQWCQGLHLVQATISLCLDPNACHSDCDSISSVVKEHKVSFQLKAWGNWVITRFEAATLQYGTVDTPIWQSAFWGKGLQVYLLILPMRLAGSGGFKLQSYLYISALLLYRLLLKYAIYVDLLLYRMLF